MAFKPQTTNTRRVYRYTVTDSRGEAIPAGTFTGSETLRAYLYVGDPTAPLATLTASWDTTRGPNPALEGKPVVAWEVTPSTLSGITNFEPGLYRYQVVANPDDDKVDLANGFHHFVGGAGALTAPSNYTTADGLKVYCTFDDVLRVAGWVTNLIVDSPWMRSNLSEYREEARKRIDQILLSRASRDLGYQLESHSPVDPEDELEITAGLDAGPDYGPSIYADPDIKASLNTISGYLSDDLLSLSDGMIRKIAANLTVHEICQSQIGNIKNSETPYQVFGMGCERRALMLLAGYSPKITPDDDQPTIELRP